MKYFDKNNLVEMPNILDVDKSVRRAAHSLTDKICQKYDVYKVYLFRANSNFGGNQSDYNNILIVLKGSPTKSLLSADSEIIKLGYEVAEAYQVKLYATVLFQNEFESSELTYRKDLIDSVKNTGLEVIQLNELKLAS